jgi:hypothetical protein
MRRMATTSHMFADSRVGRGPRGVSYRCLILSSTAAVATSVGHGSNPHLMNNTPRISGINTATTRGTGVGFPLPPEASPGRDPQRPSADDTAQCPETGAPMSEAVMEKTPPDVGADAWRHPVHAIATTRDGPMNTTAMQATHQLGNPDPRPALGRYSLSSTNPLNAGTLGMFFRSSRRMMVVWRSICRRADESLCRVKLKGCGIMQARP